MRSTRLTLALSSSLLIVTLAGAVRASAAPPPPGGGGPQPIRVDPRSQLMITDLAVVEDRLRTDPRNGERAAWTFKHLIEGMAGGQDTSEFVLHWLELWEKDQVVNGRVVAARPAIREKLIDPWLAASGGSRLDLNRAPFKLLAIVNRMDLRQHEGASVITAGEGRFVFGVLAPDGKPLLPIASDEPGGFTVIFEYELPARDMKELGAWTKLWADLGKLRLGSSQYNQALERITRRYSDAGSAPMKPNGNALDQIRTNELSLARPWQLREFVIDRHSGQLAAHTVANTADSIELNGTPDLATLINANEASLLAGTFDFPDSFLGASSLAGPFVEADFPDFAKRSFVTFDQGEGGLEIPWSAAGIHSNDARQAFAVGTCGGCHRNETGTDFIHVGFPAEHRLPRTLGRPAALSGFLTGIALSDPVDGTTSRSFGDLERRRLDLTQLIRSFSPMPSGPGPVDKPHKPRLVH